MSSESWDVEVKTTGDFEPFEVPPDGAIPARICAMIDVGTHDARKMDGSTYERHYVILGFELAETDSKGKPFFMAKPYTLSLSTKSSLFEMVKALNGEPKLGEKLNPAWLANKPCLLQISHETKTKKGKDRTYANIDSVGKPPKGTPTPPGSCIVWRIKSGQPLPDVSHLPPIWHEDTGKMLKVNEWAACCHELTAAMAGDVRMPPQQSQHNPAMQPMTQEEADSGLDVPF